MSEEKSKIQQAIEKIRAQLSDEYIGISPALKDALNLLSQAEAEQKQPKYIEIANKRMDASEQYRCGTCCFWRGKPIRTSIYAVSKICKSYKDSKLRTPKDFGCRKWRRKQMNKNRYNKRRLDVKKRF